MTYDPLKRHNRNVAFWEAAWFIYRFLFVVIVVGLTIAIMAACAPMELAREPVVITKEVERIVQVKCEDKRAPAPDFPDDDQDLAQVREGDIFGLAQIYRAARELYRQRLRDDDAQIAACVGG